MNEQIDKEKIQEILEWNTCCKREARLKASKASAKENGHLTLDEKLKKIREVPYMGHAVKNTDGTITLHAVNYFKEGKHLCACSNFNQSNFTE